VWGGELHAKRWYLAACISIARNKQGEFHSPWQ